MSKWGNFIHALKVTAAVATLAGKAGVKFKDVPLDKIVDGVEQVVKDAKKEAEKVKASGPRPPAVPPSSPGV